jgi:isopropylmalate/homocitrate/citramalate synthase
MSLAGVDQPSNRPITGEKLFSVESGIIATWVRNVRDIDITEAVPFKPSLVGQTGPHMVLGKGSGVDSVVDALEQIGVSADEDDMLKILGLVKDASLLKKGLLSPEDFRGIVKEVLH